MKTGMPSARRVFCLILVAIALSSSCSPIARPTPTRTATLTATHAPATPKATRLPIEGQLIIPKGYRFTVPDGMVGTTWHFPPVDEAENIFKFTAGVASDRASKYGGHPEDYLTVIWTSEPLTEGDGSRCPDTFYSQPGVGDPGTAVGSKNCIVMLEYRLTQ